MVGSQGPTGSVTWSADPSQPGGFTQTTTLSPEQQQLYNLYTQAQQGALGVANQQIGRVGEALGQGFDLNSLPALASGLQAPQLQSQLNTQGTQASFTNPLQQGGNGYGGIQSIMDATANVPGVSNITQQWAQNPINFQGVGGGGGGNINVASGVSGAGQGIVNSFDTGGPIQTSIGGLGPLQNTFDPGQAVQGQVGQYGQITNTFDGGQPLNDQIANAGQIQRQVGPTDFSADRQAVTDAVIQQAMSRLNPQFQQQDNALLQRLANQGIGINSEAYKNAVLQQGMVQTDARNQALYSGIQQGAAEQNQLFNQAVAQGQFSNNAQNQQYVQNANDAAFRNATAAQQFGQNQQQAQFQNAAQAQGFGQNLAQGQFANEAAAQQYAQNMGLAQFGNQAAQQQFDAGLAQGTFANAAQAQQYGQNLGAAQFTNDAQGQGFNQAATSAQIQNQGAGIQMQGQQLAQQGQLAALQAQMRQRELDLAAQQQAYSQAFGNQALGFEQLMQQQAASNQAAGQNFGQNLAGMQANNGALIDQYNAQLAGGQFQNQARNQALQEQAYVQNQPLNQFNSLMASGQVSTPQGIQYTPTQVGQTDVLGAYALNQQAQQAAYNAQMQQRQGLLGGLFGLGSAAIMATNPLGGLFGGAG